jgi:hypothetical protein
LADIISRRKVLKKTVTEPKGKAVPENDVMGIMMRLRMAVELSDEDDSDSEEGEDWTDSDEN